MSFDWQSLISDNVEKKELASNIREICKWKSRDPSEVVLTVTDEKCIVAACQRAVHPQLTQLFESIGASEKLLTLILNYIITINSLTMALFDGNQLIDMKFEPIITKILSSKLQLRHEFLKADWPIEDENSNSLLDSVCTKHFTLTSFRSSSYKDLHSDYFEHATNNQKEILQNVWMNGNELRTKIQQYNLPFSLADKLEAQGVRQLDSLTEHDVKTLIQNDQIELKQKLSSIMANTAEVNVINDAHNRLKANLAQMFKNEGHQGRQAVEQRRTELMQRKQRTEDAIKLVEDMNKNLNKLSGNSSDLLQSTLNEVATKLNVNWQFTENELSKPDTLLKSILVDLNNANEQLNISLCAASKSDEDIIEHINGGIVFYGTQLTDPKRLGEKAQRPLLSHPAHCELKSPSLSFESKQHKFTSLEASNQFIKTIKTSGLSVATYFETSYAQSSCDISSLSDQNKAQSTVVIQVNYTIVPIKCFRIPREEMTLSREAENVLAGVNTLRKAAEFLQQFHSHISDGVQHIGGIFIRTVTVETKEETDVQSLETLAAKTMRAPASAEADVSFETNTNQQGNEKIVRTATITQKIQCFGPPCNNPDLFVQVLYSNSSSWYIIDRDEFASFIPVWEIVQMRYLSQVDMTDAANLLKHAWLIQAQKLEHIPLIKSEIQRIRYKEYISNVDRTPNLTSISTNGSRKSNLEMLELQINQCLANFDAYELSPSLFLNEVLEIFQLIHTRSQTCREDFLPMLLQRDTMKCFLKSILLSYDDTVVHYIMPTLALLLSAEKIQDLYQKQAELEPDILRIIQEYHTNTHNDNDVLITNRSSDDSKVIDYQRQIRKNITNWFQKKALEEQTALSRDQSKQQAEFDKIYESIVVDILQKDPREYVESNVRRLYADNGMDPDYKTDDLVEMMMSSSLMSTLTITDLWVRKYSCTSDLQKQAHQNFLLELVLSIEDLLAPVKRYSDSIVQDAINCTHAKLAEKEVHYWTNGDYAHRTVCALLVLRLMGKESEWDRHNSISIRLMDARDNLYNFYCNLTQGKFGVQLLTSDLRFILQKNYRPGLKEKIIKYISHKMQSERWVMDNWIVMVHAELEFLQHTKAERTDEVIDNVTVSSADYEKIVSQSIEQNITSYVHDQLAEYDESLKLSFHSAVIKTQAYVNPLCDTNKEDQSGISQGRTRYFLQELTRNFNKYNLPHIYANAVRTLDYENYIRCDDESPTIWLEIVIDLFQTLSDMSNVKLTDDEKQSILKNAVDEIVDKQRKEADKMKCSIPCPMCKMPCKRALGHTNSFNEYERRHHCDHKLNGSGEDIRQRKINPTVEN